MKRQVALIFITVGALAGLGLFFSQSQRSDQANLVEAQSGVDSLERAKSSRPELPVSKPLGAPEIYQETLTSSSKSTLSLEQALRFQLQNKVGRNVGLETTKLKKVENWVFVCGRPLELNGSDLDYTQSKLSKYHAIGMVDDNFCAVLRDDSGTYSVLAFDLGSTDNPYGKWVETYNLPKGLIGTTN